MNTPERFDLDLLLDESEAKLSEFENLATRSPNDADCVRFVRDVEQWLRKCAEAGRYLSPGAADRRAMAALLEEWNSRLRRYGHRPQGIDGLANFDRGAGVYLDPAACPYPGLHSYGADQRTSFFGRGALTERYARRLIDNRIFLILGASGSGKSSLGLAGIQPWIRERYPDWLYVKAFTPGATPLLALARAVTEVTGGSNLASSLAEALRHDPAAAPARIESVCGGRPLLLFIDQFEELLTLCRDSAEQHAVARVLVALSDPAAGSWACRSLLTLRTDHLARFDTSDALHPLHTRLVDQRNCEQLTALEFADIRRAIVEPARKVGLRFIPADIPDRLASETAGLASGLPLLQFALRRLWETRPQNEQGEPLDLINEDMVKALPDVQRALGTVANQVFDTLTPQQQRICERLMLELVVLDENFEEPLRRRRGREELMGVLVDRFPGAEMDIATVEERFLRAGLLRGFDTGEERRIEVTHEALLRHWTHINQLLSGDEAKRRLHAVKQIAREAMEWKTHGENEDRLKQQGRPLQDALIYLADGWLADAESRSYLEACTRREEAALMQARQLELEREYTREARDAALVAESKRAQAQVRWVRSAAVLAGVLTICFGMLWWNADEAMLESRARQAAQESNTSRGLDDDRAQLLAVDGYERRSLPITRVALLQAYARNGDLLRTLRGHNSAMTAVAYSPDGKIIATANDDNTVRLWDPSGKPLKMLEGHERSVTHVVFSPDGKTIATASADNTARLWDTSGKQLKTFEGHKGAVTHVAFSPDGKTIVTASTDNTARLWDTGGSQLKTFEGHKGAVTHVAFSLDGKTIATASADNTARLWDTSGSQLKTFEGHRDAVMHLAFSPDGKTIATASADRTARLWDTSGALLTTFEGRKEVEGRKEDEGHKGVVTHVAFSPDGKTIATASADRTARLWDTSGSLLKTFEGHRDAVMHLTFSPDGKTIATASADNTARLWDTSGSQLKTFEGHKGAVRHLAFSPDGKTIATASADNTARLWDTSGSQLKTLEGHERLVTHLAFSLDGKIIATASADKTTRLWDTSGKQLKTFEGHQGAVMRLAFSPDGKTIATASADNTARLWDTSGKQLKTFEGHKGAVMHLAFSPDGKTIATASADNTARLWDTSGKQLKTFEGHKGAVTYLAFSPDGKTIATASADNTARLWDISGSPLKTFEGHERPVAHVAFSPDGKTIATASADNTARLWDTSGKQLKTFEGHKGAVTYLAFSPDGKTIATASADNTARLWDISGKQLKTFEGHKEAVTRLAFSPDRDGMTIATASVDKTARLWDTSGSLLKTFEGHRDAVMHLTFSPDGKTIATASADNIARLFRCYECTPAEDAVKAIKQRAGNELSEEDRRTSGLPAKSWFRRQFPW